MNLCLLRPSPTLTMALCMSLLMFIPHDIVPYNIIIIPQYHRLYIDDVHKSLLRNRETGGEKNVGNAMSLSLYTLLYLSQLQLHTGIKKK